jgi:hypothetical protein
MGVSDQHHAPAALYPPGKGPPVPIGQEAGWAPEQVWTQRLEEKSFAPDGDRTPIARSSSSKTLYCLSYPAPVWKKMMIIIQRRTKSSIIWTLHHDYDGQIKGDEMNGKCSTYWVYLVRFRVLMAASMKIRAFRDIAPSCLGVYRRFRGAYCLHHQGDLIFWVYLAHVDGVTLCLWNANTNGPTVHAPGDIWAWRATVEWYWQGKTEEREKNCPSATYKSHMKWQGVTWWEDGD